MEITTVKEFAKTQRLRADDVRRLIKQCGVRVVDQRFDGDRLRDALARYDTNYTAGKGMHLAPTTGLGAIKHLLDRLDVEIVQHETRRSQWLSLRHNNICLYYKVQYRSKAARLGLRVGLPPVCDFTITGTHPDDPQYAVQPFPDRFLFVCYKPLCLWAITPRAANKDHDALHTGAVTMNSAYEVTHVRDLGF